MGELAPCTLRQLLLYFLRLGMLGFGGPVALVGYIERDLVEARRWISRQDYLEGLAFAQLSPGPLAAQLAMYLGWVRGRILGATLVGLVFVWPSFAMVVILAMLYLAFGGLPWMQAVFYGISAAVIAIIARSAVKLVRITIQKDRLLWMLFAASAAVTAWTESEIVWVFIGSGILAVLVKAPPRFLSRGGTLASVAWPAFLLTGAGGAATPGTLAKILLYFTEAGAFVFGSGLAIVPFLYGGVVQEYHWLNDRQFLDAIAVAMITPGPVVITVGFIGYLVGGLAGAVLAAVGTFVPCYLATVVLAPYYRRFAQHLHVKAFVAGVTSAATGAITGAAFILGKRALIDVPAILICLVTLALLLKVKKIPEPLLILGSGVVGLLLRGGAP